MIHPTSSVLKKSLSPGFRLMATSALVAVAPVVSAFGSDYLEGYGFASDAIILLMLAVHVACIVGLLVHFARWAYWAHKGIPGALRVFALVGIYLAGTFELHTASLASERSCADQGYGAYSVAAKDASAAFVLGACMARADGRSPI